ncbi:MAG TPA: hypothetical protein VH639_29890 [Bryobacteraceae bacterium]|jgi:hypothetical protein
MAASTQPLSVVYVWEAPGNPLAVHFDLAIVDNLLAEIMRGFAAVPKRGAEVGGLLIGTIEGHEDGPGGVVRVEDFELVQCVYARGPSYLLTSEDREPFEAACARWRPESRGPAAKQAVGYFRSHTRDGLALGVEDLELLDRYFPDPRHLGLLIRPFASQPAEAGFFFRENGVFPTESPRVFTFSRLDMADRSAPASSSEGAEELDSKASAEAIRAAAPRVGKGAPRTFIPLLDETPDQDGGKSVAPATEKQRTGWSRWLWIPLAIALLAAGAVAGFEASQTIRASMAPRDLGEFSLALRVIPIGDNLAVRWDPDARAVRNAQSGLLVIEDGGYSKPVDLDSAHLQSGSILYRSSSSSVRFRLTMYEGARVSVTETVDWPH